ncbi:hypothetical protein CL630_00080 [bacterium]|nr:hypothetical protein [bacterium]|tara:strand:+ start:4040 stop:4525 length:486 start_codon:yes stop_codon:yes gene_type:complete
MKKLNHELRISGTGLWRHKKVDAPINVLIHVKDGTHRRQLQLHNGHLQPCAIANISYDNPNFTMHDSDMGAMGASLDFFIPDGPSVDKNSLTEVHRTDVVRRPHGSHFEHFSHHIANIMRNPPVEATKAKFILYLYSKRFFQPRKFWFPYKMERHFFVFYC